MSGRAAFTSHHSSFYPEQHKLTKTPPRITQTTMVSHDKITQEAQAKESQAKPTHAAQAKATQPDRLSKPTPQPTKKAPTAVNIASLGSSPRDVSLTASPAVSAFDRVVEDAVHDTLSRMAFHIHFGYEAAGVTDHYLFNSFDETQLHQDLKNSYDHYAKSPTRTPQADPNSVDDPLLTIEATLYDMISAVEDSFALHGLRSHTLGPNVDEFLSGWQPPFYPHIEGLTYNTAHDPEADEAMPTPSVDPPAPLPTHDDDVEMEDTSSSSSTSGSSGVMDQDEDSMDQDQDSDDPMSDASASPPTGPTTSLSHGMSLRSRDPLPAQASPLSPQRPNPKEARRTKNHPFKSTVEKYPFIIIDDRVREAVRGMCYRVRYLDGTVDWIKRHLLVEDGQEEPCNWVDWWYDIDHQETKPYITYMKGLKAYRDYMRASETGDCVVQAINALYSAAGHAPLISEENWTDFCQAKQIGSDEGLGIQKTNALLSWMQENGDTPNVSIRRDIFERNIFNGTGKGIDAIFDTPLQAGLYFVRCKLSETLGHAMALQVKGAQKALTCLDYDEGKWLGLMEIESWLFRIQGIYHVQFTTGDSYPNQATNRRAKRKRTHRRGAKTMKTKKTKQIKTV